MITWRCRGSAEAAGRAAAPPNRAGSPLTPRLTCKSCVQMASAQITVELPKSAQYWCYNCSLDHNVSAVGPHLSRSFAVVPEAQYILARRERRRDLHTILDGIAVPVDALCARAISQKEERQDNLSKQNQGSQPTAPLLDLYLLGKTGTAAQTQGGRSWRSGCSRFPASPGRRSRSSLPGRWRRSFRAPCRCMSWVCTQ